jgi:hypothetical protein
VDCRQVAEWRGLRPDSEELQGALAAHLRTCADCAEAQSRSSAFDALLRQSLVATPPPELSLRLLALARAASAPVQARKHAVTSARREPIVTPVWQQLAAFALAAVTAVALGDALGYRGWELSLVAAAELATALRVVLTSPISWLLPDTGELLADVWGMVPAMALAAALLPLAWLSRSREPSEGALRER